MPQKPEIKFAYARARTFALLSKQRPYIYIGAHTGMQWHGYTSGKARQVAWLYKLLSS